MTPLRLARLAAVLGFVAFIAACIIPADLPPPVVSVQPGYAQGPPPSSGPPMMSGGPIEAGCSYNGTQLPGDVGAQFQIAFVFSALVVILAVRSWRLGRQRRYLA